MRVTVISTVLNEGESIRGLMDSLAAQTRKPDEVVIVDGGSRDDTVDLIEEYGDRLNIHVSIAPGCNISEGRNIAIDSAIGDVIAATDAGVKLSANWLHALIAPFEVKPDLQVCAGFFHADAHTTFEVAMGATVLPLVDEIDPNTFLPSSRSVAFRKYAWEAVGGYPEWLDYSEDLIFDLRLKDKFVDFAFAPDAIAHFRPRHSLRAFIKQYYLYARGDGKADLWRKRHAIRYVTYLVVIPAIALLGAIVSPAFWLLYLLGALIYLYRPYRRLATLWSSAPDQSTSALIRAILLVPIIRVVGDIAKMLGYPVGVAWRLRNHPPDWRNPSEDTQ